VFISFISRKAEELEQNLSPNHMVCGNTRFFKNLTTTLDVAQGFPLLTEGAVRGVLFAPMMKKGTTWEL
jgi:hypothetical protein